MTDEELYEKSRWRLRAEDLLGRTFVLQKFAALDMISSLRGVEAGHIVSQPYEGESIDLKHAKVIKGGWNHEHCFLCHLEIVAGDEWWVALNSGHLGLCPGCRLEYEGIRQELAAGVDERREIEGRRSTLVSNVAIDESEWLTSSIPRDMVKALKDREKAREIDRELRLFACACARRTLSLLVDERSVKAIEVAERYAEGNASPEELDDAGEEARYAASDLYVSGGLAAADQALMKHSEASAGAGEVGSGDSIGERAWHAAKAAEEVTRRKVGIAGTARWYEGGAWVAATTASMSAAEAIADAVTLRERAAVYLEACNAYNAPLKSTNVVDGAAELRAREEGFGEWLERSRLSAEPWQAALLRCIFGNPFRPVSLDSNCLTAGTRELAEAIDRDRAYERLPELADALEQAGCRDVAVLDHCRMPGEHATGCWVINAVLGKRQATEVPR